MVEFIELTANTAAYPLLSAFEIIIGFSKVTFFIIALLTVPKNA